MDDNCGEWVECMGVASGCGCKEVYRFSYYVLIPTPLVSVLFCSSIPTFCSFLKMYYYNAGMVQPKISDHYSGLIV